jgi:hypothetical protein
VKLVITAGTHLQHSLSFVYTQVDILVPPEMAPPSAIDPPEIEDTHTATIIGKLSINGVPGRRAKAPQMPPGVAPHTSSEVFKGSVSCLMLTWAMLTIIAI